MTPKLKNILIVSAIIVGVVLIYVFFIKSPQEEQAGLVSVSSNGNVSSATDTLVRDSEVTREFLSLLLNVKNIKLDDRIFADVAFGSLRDSSIVLIPDGTEGRPNPFAPIGFDTPNATFSPPVPATSTPPTKAKTN